MTYETVTKVEDLPLRYPHHRKALEELVRIFSSKDGVIALVLGGSLARGSERADSDIDAMAVVTDAFYEEKKRELHTAEMISMGDCAYPGGYFDLKYMTKDYIRDAANKGSEPTRSSFLGSKVLFSADPEVTELVGKIPIFQKQEVEEKMLSFYSDLQLSYGYFWKISEPKSYMKLHTGDETIYCLYRMVLQENGILFPCNRRLEEAVVAAPDKPEHLVEYCREFCRTMEEEPLRKAVEAWRAWTKYDWPKDEDVTLSRYIDDFEQWWHIPRPLIGEW